MSKSNALIIFRVDTRGAAGKRSLERCLMLAAAHQQRGGRAQFAIQQNQQTARNLIAAKGLAELTISGTIGSEHDAEELLCAAANCGASSIVVDGRSFGAAYLQTLSQTIFTAVMEDEGERVLPVQLIINSSFSADERFYTCRADSRLLLGPSFKLVSPEIANWPAPERAPRSVIKRLFVHSEDDHASARVLDALPVCKGTTIVTVLGSRTCKILDTAARAACSRGYIIEQISRSAATDALFLTDAAIVTSESFSGLIGFLGIPSLCLSNDRDDARETHRMAEEGANVHTQPLREMSNQQLESTIEDFILDEAQRRRFSNRVAGLIDGNGGERILDIMREMQTPKLRILKAA